MLGGFEVLAFVGVLHLGYFVSNLLVDRNAKVCGLQAPGSGAQDGDAWGGT